MKTAFLTHLSYSAPALPETAEATVEQRPRSAKMDKFMSQINGSPRYDVKNVAARVRHALQQSKKVA